MHCNWSFRVQHTDYHSFQIRMEVKEENGGNVSLKRQRAPLSDSEDNVLSTSGLGLYLYQQKWRLHVWIDTGCLHIPSSLGLFHILWLMLCLCLSQFFLSEMNDGQKRRRLEAAGQENRSPKPSSSGRIAELEMKPDTPMVPSIRSRVQQLTRRQDGKTESLHSRH